MYYLKYLRCGVCLLALAMLSACGGGAQNANKAANSANAADSSNAPLLNVVGPYIAGDNVIDIVVDAGPSSNYLQVNRLYASVTICVPGSNDCHTIDHVLLDTGSTGLRLLSSVVPSTLKLPPARNTPLYACQQYLDGSYSWGSVVIADLTLGGKTATKMPVQIVTAPSPNQNTRISCTGSDAITNADNLGANGILGIGMNTEDCGPACVSNANVGYYYTCTGSTCTGTTVALNQQLQNPVPHFSNDNNGFVIQLPAIDGNRASSVKGSMLFGIGTQSNNIPPSTLTQLQADNNSGFITTTLAGGTPKRASFLDTGSNGIFFDAAIAQCSYPLLGFYCPANTSNYTAQLSDNHGNSKAVHFSIDSASAILSRDHHVYPTLGGTINNSAIFDWGLPFFYGRNIYIGIENTGSTLGTGAYYAF